jgi:S-DNA-T family DNA segregation ATPase FtsK/SpoIIIE
MPAKKKTKNTKKNEKPMRFSFLSDMNPDKKSNLLKITGVIVMVFAVLTLLSTVSYLFTWMEDQSLLSQPDMMDRNVDVSNWGGKIGYRWSHFLVAGCFGLGSFALIFLMGAVAFRLFFWKRSIGLLKTTFITVSGAFVASLVLAYASLLFGASTSFGGGLGGDAGAAVVDGLVNLFGMVISGLVIVAVIICWLILSNGRFSHWFATTGEFRPSPAEPEPELPLEEDDSVDYEEETLEPTIPVEPAYVPAYEPEPEPEPVPAPSPEPVAVPDYKDVLAHFGADFPADVIPAEPVVPEGEMEVIMSDDYAQEVTEDLPRIDNRQELERYKFPPLDLLNDNADGRHTVSKQELEINNNKIRATLQNYKIQVEKVTAVVGPTVTLYKIYPAPAVRISSIEVLHKEIAISLNTRGVRVVTLSDCVGIEVANSTPSIVPLKSMLNDDSFRNSKAELPIALGYTITQEVKTFDLADAPHLLIAGATKQGKSVGLNVIISSLLYAKHPTELKFVFIDPKMVEFTAYNALLKHYLAVLPMAANEEEERENAIIKQPKQAEQVLNSLCIEMDERYKLLAAAGVNAIKDYNEKYKDRHLLPQDGHKFLPYLVVVIDEYADLTMTGGANPDARKCAKNISDSIVRLAQKGRAAGLHVIIATQRPSVNVITGLIKTNFPTRIAFRVVSGVDSRTILDSYGAENLIGRGDMLYYAGVEMERVQCALVSMAEINKITDYIGAQTGYKQCYSTPYYLPVPESQDGETSGGTIDMQNIDPMFEEAARMVVTSQKGSTSDLQRRLGMGYARAGRVMDQLEAAGVVGPQEGSKPRQVLVTTFNELDEILAAFVKD